MKIYFAGSIKGGRQDVDLYASLIEHLKEKGEVPTEHLGNPSITDKGEVDKAPEVVHERNVNWLKEADVVVAEVTVKSLGVGYELGLAVAWKKKILCLFREEEIKLTNMIKGCPGVEVRYYKTLDEAKKIIDKYFAKL